MSNDNVAQFYALKREQYRRSLYHCCKYLLGMSDINWATHGKMIAALEAPTTRKLIVMPRGSLKSSVGVVGYGIWLMLRNPNIRIMINTETYNNSTAFLRQIRQTLELESFKQIFGNLQSFPWNDSAITVRGRTRAVKEATFSASSITSSRVGAHYDVIINDDLNSQKNSDTPEGREKVLTHHRMNQAILDPGGTLVIIGTRYATNDVIGETLRGELAGTHWEGYA